MRDHTDDKDWEGKPMVGGIESTANPIYPGNYERDMSIVTGSWTDGDHGFIEGVDYADPPVDVCSWCGKHCGNSGFNSEERGERSFCDRTCRSKFRNADRVHSTRYGKQWQLIREEVIEEAGEQCELCGMGRGRCRFKYGTDLHVHHLKPLREFKSTALANRKSNLEALCPSCHAKEEQKI